MPGDLTRDQPLRDGVTLGTATALLRWMIVSRAIEDRLRILYLQNRLRGRLVSGRGQEAIPVGVTMATGAADCVCPVHRDLGAHLVRGTTPRAILSHYLGRASGPSGGRDGDLHVGEWSRGVFPMVSHLPDSWPVAGGIALAATLRGEPRVVVAFCGDGATSTGAWHEALNFASVFQTPNVFVVENNHYAYSTPTSRQCRVARIADRAAAYGLPGVRVDGNDAIAVHAAARHAVAHARDGGGPFLIEAVTMRMDGHAVHDAAAYVPKELLEEWRVRDPIARLSGELTANGLGQADVDAMRDEAERAVDAALEAAESAPLPEARSLEDRVFA
jgi:TPP-dependent pyruvate/acetoin dehydrogenase alpha subunit